MAASPSVLITLIGNGKGLLIFSRHPVRQVADGVDRDPFLGKQEPGCGNLGMYLATRTFIEQATLHPG